MVWNFSVAVAALPVLLAGVVPAPEPLSELQADASIARARTAARRPDHFLDFNIRLLPSLSL